MSILRCTKRRYFRKRVDFCVLRTLNNVYTKAIRIILTGTHEQMIKLQREGKLYQWMKVYIRYLKNIFSIENPVSYVLHLDEVTDEDRTFFRITIPCR